MKRRQLLLTLLLLLLLGGLLLVPQVRWPIYGWLRGEAFYQGMPTSYWSIQIDRHYGLTKDRIDDLRQLLGLRSGVVSDDRVLSVDVGAVPVLTELLSDPEPKVRWAAVWQLYMVAPENQASIPVLLDLLRASETYIRNDAIYLLGEFRSRARGAIPVLREGFKREAPLYQNGLIIEALEKIDRNVVDELYSD
jgi:hypothetical protein